MRLRQAWGIPLTVADFLTSKSSRATSLILVEMAPSCLMSGKKVRRAPLSLNSLNSSTRARAINCQTHGVTGTDAEKSLVDRPLWP